MKRCAFALCAALLLAGLLPGSTLAAVVVDQHNSSGGFYVHGGDYGQTFTVGKTGMLTQVDLYLMATEVHSLTVKLVGVTGDSPPMPNFAAKRSAVVDVPLVKGGGGTWVQFPMPPYAVTAGQMYAIVFSLLSSQGAFYSGDTYSGGRACELATPSSYKAMSPAKDFAFKTYVDEAAATPTPVPTPTHAATHAATSHATAAASSGSTGSLGATESASTVASETPGGVVATATAGPGSGSGGSTDPTIPIVAGGIVGLGLLGGGLWLVLRRRRQATT